MDKQHPESAGQAHGGVLQTRGGGHPPEEGHQAVAEGLQRDPGQQPGDDPPRRHPQDEQAGQRGADRLPLHRRLGPGGQGSDRPGPHELGLDAAGHLRHRGDRDPGVVVVQEPAQRLPGADVAHAVLQEPGQQPGPAGLHCVTGGGRELQGGTAGLHLSAHLPPAGSPLQGQQAAGQPAG